MYKKFIAGILALCTIAALSGCAESTDNSSTIDNTDSSVSESSDADSSAISSEESSQAEESDSSNEESSDNKNDNKTSGNEFTQDEIDEWMMTTPLESRFGDKLFTMLKKQSRELHSNRIFTTFKNKDEPKEIKVNYLSLEMLGDKFTWNGSPITVEQNDNELKVLTDTDEDFELYAPSFIKIGDKLLIYHELGRSTYRLAKAHLYDKDGKEVGSKEYTQSGEGASLYLFGDLPENVASFSFDYARGYSSYFGELKEGDEYFDFDYNVMSTANDFAKDGWDFGYDANCARDISKNPYKDNYDEGTRYAIFRQDSDSPFRNRHLTIIGISVGDDGECSDIVEKTFSVTTEKGYDAQLLEENKFWLHIND